MGWVTELLLESPVPPSNYLPDRRSRLGIARASLRGGAPVRNLVGSSRLRDLGSAHPFFSGSRVVSPEVVADEIEADIRSINRPVMQGWMVGVLVPAVGLAFPGVRQLSTAADPVDVVAAIFLIALPFIATMAVITFASARILGLDLRGDRVFVRSWLGATLGRPGRDLGPAGSLRAGVDGSVLVISGPTGGAILSLRAWPPSARREIVDELPLWGVDTPFVERPSRRAERDRRRREMLARREARTRRPRP